MAIIPLANSGIAILSLVVLGIVSILGYFAKRRRRREFRKLEKEVNDFKLRSRKILISYEDLEIKSNSWKQEIEVGSGTKSRNEYVDIHANTIILDKTIDNIPFHFECNIEMPADLLRMKLAIKNHIGLYYNPENPEERYLDLAFLIPDE